MTEDEPTIEFPDWFDVRAQTEALDKGYLEPVVVRFRGRSFRLRFFDPTRLMQDIEDELAERGWYADSELVVVPQVTVEAIRSAVLALARHDFAPWQGLQGTSGQGEA